MSANTVTIRRYCRICKHTTKHTFNEQTGEAKCLARKHQGEVMATALSSKSHPNLFKALLIVAHDNDMINRDNPEPEAIISRKDSDTCAKAEVAVAKLSEYDLETFAIGEETEQQEVVSRDPDLVLAGDILNDYFEGVE